MSYPLPILPHSSDLLTGRRNLSITCPFLLSTLIGSFCVAPAPYASFFFSLHFYSSWLSSVLHPLNSLCSTSYLLKPQSSQVPFLSLAPCSPLPPFPSLNLHASQNKGSFSAKQAPGIQGCFGGGGLLGIPQDPSTGVCGRQVEASKERDSLFGALERWLALCTGRGV